MLYDADTSLSRDGQASCQVEAVLAREVAQLTLAKPTARTAHKQRLTHFLQDKHLRLPHLTVRFGTQIIKNAASSLGNAVYDLYERVFVASLDAHEYTVSTWCLRALDSQWPGSSRVARLKAMRCEAAGKFTAADDLYAELLVEDPANMSVARRQVASAKGAGDLARAIALLTKYVSTFSSDESAWVELSELYLQTAQYDLAAFAVEELLMLAPENYTYSLKYAELQYTLGAMDIARQYYAHSLELKPNNNLRALYGLVLTLQTKQGAGGATNAQQLHQWSADQLLAHYRKFCPHLTPMANLTLNGGETTATSATAPASASSTPVATSSAPAAAAASTPAAASPEEDTAEEAREPQETDLPD